MHPKDTEAIADAIVELIDDKNKYQEIVSFSRELADNKYSWDTIAHQTIEVYKCV